MFKNANCLRRLGKMLGGIIYIIGLHDITFKIISSLDVVCILFICTLRLYENVVSKVSLVLGPFGTLLK